MTEACVKLTKNSPAQSSLKYSINGIVGEWEDLSSENIESWMANSSGTLKTDGVALDLGKVSSPKLLVLPNTSTKFYEMYEMAILRHFLTLQKQMIFEQTDS